MFLFQHYYLHTYFFTLFFFIFFQSSLVAQNISKEVVEDILEYMLEAWLFGEWSPPALKEILPPNARDDNLNIDSMEMNNNKNNNNNDNRSSNGIHKHSKYKSEHIDKISKHYIAYKNKENEKKSNENSLKEFNLKNSKNFKEKSSGEKIGTGSVPGMVPMTGLKVARDGNIHEKVGGSRLW